MITYRFFVNEPEAVSCIGCKENFSLEGAGIIFLVYSSQALPSLAKSATEATGPQVPAG